jgi:hypothetical protein
MLVRIAAREPACLIALVILFACFEVAFYVVLQTVADEVSRLFPLFWVLGANLLATAVMGVYLWKRYPELGRALEPPGIAVRRAVQHHHRRAGRDVDPADRCRTASHRPPR